MDNSKNSFKNFWDYNKRKVIAGFFLIAFIIFAITQCNINPEQKFGILCISETNNTDGTQLMAELKENIDFDKTEEGKQNLEYEHIYIPPTKADMVTLGTNETIQARLLSGDASLLILDSETIYYYEAKGTFKDLTEVADKYNIPAEDRYLATDGSVCAISVDSNSFLKDCSIESEGLYVAIRYPLNGNTEDYTNADAALDYIISNK
ncbi:MAG: hypothetical protein II998_02810 [Clostridia bacterium]|nr:hypothetical protein [Clostridia bacterium]